MNDQKIRLLMVEDHFVVRAGLLAIINTQPDMTVVAQAESGQQAIELYTQHAPDVTLMDLQIPGPDGISAIRAILNGAPDAKIMVLSTYGGEEQIVQAMQAGARGYFLKHVKMEQLLSAIRAIHSGEQRLPPEVEFRITERLGRPELTAREREVLVLMARGLADEGIAVALQMSPITVRVHVSRLIVKLGCEERSQAVAEAFRRGFVRLDPTDGES
jgi:two-component system, NarL family, response regulator